MQYLLECHEVTKKYGCKKALDRLNLVLPEGRILGLLGPNGAGKTTLIKLIVGLLRSYQGEITIAGSRPGVATKAIVSYMPDREFLYPWMNVGEAVNFFDQAFADFDRNRALGMIDDLGIHLKDKVKSLSKGMQERVNMSLIFARQAKLFVLDEPLAAVDPSTRDKIMRIILDYFDPASSIILSTHLVHDVEQIFTDVAIVSDGKVLLQGSVEHLHQTYQQSIESLFKELV
ncbi:multidrug ABC transporter ATP-binding protein [Paenibacillus sp. CAA11]|uniref:ABC transporter ATP-binding protein n=1 Tax=Paenibacillus sp. CAA11 TaxID=1532905 RepID=UPI000D38C6DD|nr:ABC transporter ATP-binding protein [Paenibacillus sp. CAA11]AWB43538.1 multidrug ABC transporter ATP-binding protein [Paenibacillus sp. CAA11]